MYAQVDSVVCAGVHLVVVSAANPSFRIGHVIRDARRSRRLGQEAAAELVGVKQQQLSKWEAGTARPTLEHAAALAEFLHLDLTEVLQLLHADQTGASAPQGRALVHRLDALQAVLHEAVERIDALERIVAVDALTVRAEAVDPPALTLAAEGDRAPEPGSAAVAKIDQVRKKNSPRPAK